LARNIRNGCAWGKDHCGYFPRCYDVNDVAEMENFYLNFMETYAQSLLKKFVDGKGTYPQEIIERCIEIVERGLLPIDKKIELIRKNVNLAVTQ
jgi:hypothetical protein